MSLHVLHDLPRRDGAELVRAVAGDMRAFRDALAQAGLAEAFSARSQRDNWHAPLALALDWLLIAAAFALVWYGHLAWAPVSLIVIGNRQRALGNLLHEAGHGMLLKRTRASDRMASWLIAPALFSTLAAYRYAHNTHHKHLGSLQQDPDLVHDERFDQPQRWHRLLWDELTRPAIWAGSTWGGLAKMSGAQRACVALWWALVLGGVGALVGPAGALAFALMWLVAKASVFHVLTTFREIADHAGLEPGSLLGFTRNNPTQGPLRHLFHPHCNGYHLLHHLAPRAPYHCLPKLHEIAQSVAIYRDAEHCHGYFIGPRSVVRSWERSSAPAARSEGARALAR